MFIDFIVHANNYKNSQITSGITKNAEINVFLQTNFFDHYFK